jgi:hypothetical protein
MSGSVRRRPFSSCCGGNNSQKKAKVCGNRTLRHRNRQELHTYGDDAEFLVMDEVLSLWDMPQDGRRSYWSWPKTWLSHTNHPRHALDRRPPPDPDREYRRWFKWVKAK